MKTKENKAKIKRIILITTIVLCLTQTSFAETKEIHTYKTDVKVTFYDSGSCCNGKWAGQTATGVEPVAGRTIAVDPTVIPLGTKVAIVFKDERLSAYTGIYIAEDTGGAIKGNRVDLLVSGHKEAINCGKGIAELYIVEDVGE